MAAVVLASLDVATRFLRRHASDTADMGDPRADPGRVPGVQGADRAACLRRGGLWGRRPWPRARSACDHAAVVVEFGR